MCTFLRALTLVSPARLWFWGNKFSSLWGLTWYSLQIRNLWTICDLGFGRKRLEKIWFWLHLKSIKGVGEKGSRLQAWVMTIIAWKNCVGGSSRRFKGEVETFSTLCYTHSDSRALSTFGFILLPCTRKNLELEHHQEVFIKFLCLELRFYNTN